MTKKIYILAAFVILSLLLQVYLSNEFYNVQYGHSTGDSICNINETFNCEAVAASKYSHLFGVPNAILGVFLNLVLLIALFGMLLNQESKKDFTNWLGLFFYLGLLSLFMSLLLGFISFFIIKKACVFCIALYVLSILISAFTYLGFKSQGQLHLSHSLKSFGSKTFLILLASIPVLGFVSHKIIKNEYSPKKMEKEISMVLESWKASPSYSFEGVEPLFRLNPGAKVKVVEFADFLCPHCATASATLKSFLKLHNDVDFSFYAFPLDPYCNPAMNQKFKDKSPRFSCILSQGVYCAQKQGLGAELHYELFEKQNEYRNTAVKEKAKGLKDKMLKALPKLNKESWKTCMDSDESLAALISSSKLGQASKVTGTPSIYVGNKKLQSGAHFLILKEAHKTLK